MVDAIGIDIGGTNIRAARISAAGDIRDRRIESTSRAPASALSQIETLIGALFDDHTKAIGLGIPGRVDSVGGRILSGGFVDLSGLSLVEHLERRWKVPVRIDNDASMALVAEARLGAARGCAHVVMLTIGTGIGGALMLDGRLVHGRMTAGQLGHITIDIHGPPCLCGRRGCLETYSSGTALGRLAAEAGLAPSISLEQLLARDDAPSRQILAQWSQPLRAGIESLTATLDPEKVVLGGGLGHFAVQALHVLPAAASWYSCSVVPANLGDDAGIIGAALYALELGR